MEANKDQSGASMERDPFAALKDVRVQATFRVTEPGQSPTFYRIADYPTAREAFSRMAEEYLASLERYRFNDPLADERLRAIRLD